MQTVGYYCDECRLKYVQHRCKNRLPCGHHFQSSIWVYCQAFARGGEHVEMAWGHGLEKTMDIWLEADRESRNVCYGVGARTFWGTRVQLFRRPGVSWWLGEFLSAYPEAVVRAYLSRWESSKDCPDWVAFKNHPYAQRARALVRSASLPSLPSVKIPALASLCLCAFVLNSLL